MKARLNWKLFLICCLCLNAGLANGQLRGKINELLGRADTAIRVQAADTPQMATDTGTYRRLQQSLQESRQREERLQMELNELKIGALARDSVNQALLVRQIDSLRATTKGYPVVVDEDTLFAFYAARGRLTPQAVIAYD